MHLSYRWQAALVISLGLLMAILDTTIVTVVLPQIANAFNISQANYQTVTWVTTAYLLSTAAVIPIIGYLSDRVGTKTVYLTALFIFTLGSGLCVIAPNFQLLIAFRILQGIGGGALLPIAMAIIFRLFDPTERAGAIVVLMIPILLGPAFGPTLGGYLATAFSWNAIFTINLPIGVVAFILVALVLHGKDAEREANGHDKSASRGFDFLGLILSMAGFAALVYGISEAATNGWGDRTVLSYMIAGAVLLVAFAIVELLVKDPVMELRLFRSYAFTIASILLWATGAVLFASLVLVPFLFENIEHLSALTTGEIVISQGLAMAVGLVVSGKLYNNVGPRILSIAGAALVAISMVGFTHLTVTTTGWDLQPWLILRGIGLGLVTQPVQTLAVSVVSNKLMAKASSLINSTKMVFAAIGVSVLATYMAQQAVNHVKDLLTTTRPSSSVILTCAQHAGKNVQLLHACVAQHTLAIVVPQASATALNDTFFLSLIGCLICTVLAFFVGRDPAIEAAKEARKRGETVEDTRVPILAE